MNPNSRHIIRGLKLEILFSSFSFLSSLPTSLPLSLSPFFFVVFFMPSPRKLCHMSKKRFHLLITHLLIDGIVIFSLTFGWHENYPKFSNGQMRIRCILSLQCQWSSVNFLLTGPLYSSVGMNIRITCRFLSGREANNSC